MYDDTVALPNEFRIRPLENGVVWLKQGLALFARQAGMWILLWLAWMLLCLLLVWLPLGGAVITLIEPFFVTGLLMAAAWQQRGEDLDIAQLFAGFRKPRHLLALGGMVFVIKLAFVFATLILLGLTVGAELTEADLALIRNVANDQSAQIKVIEQILVGKSAGAISGLGLGFALLLLIYAALMSLMWFATPLVGLAGFRPAEAVKLSASGVLANWRPLTLYGMSCFLLIGVAMLPYLLGLLIVLPALIPTQYLAYKDIYPDYPDQLVEN